MDLKPNNFEDDEFDGEIGEDDEELPMVKTHMVIEKVAAAPKSIKTVGSPRGSTKTLGSPKKSTGKSVQPSTITAGLGSPVNINKRKTVVVTDAGTKKVIDTNDLLDLQNK